MLDINKAQAEFNRRLFGQILVNKQIVTEAQVQEAIGRQQTTHSQSKIGEILVRLGYMLKSRITEVLADQYGLKYIHSLDNIPPKVINCVDGGLALLYQIVPVSQRGGKLVIAAIDYKANIIDNLRRILDRDIIVKFTSEVTLNNALNKYYGVDMILEKNSSRVEGRLDNINDELVGRLHLHQQTLADSVQFFVGVIEDSVKRVEFLEQRVKVLEQMHSSIFEE